MIKNKKNIAKSLLIFLLLFFLIILTSCQPAHPDKTYTTFSNEFTFVGIFKFLFGWPVSLFGYIIAALCYFTGHICFDSYFFGVFFTTIIVRTLLWPIYTQQTKILRLQEVMKPEIDKINKKYENSKDLQSNQLKMMELNKVYKKHHFSQSGCFVTMLIQLIIFSSMMSVFRRINIMTITCHNGLAVHNFGTFGLKNTKLFNFFELANTGLFVSGSNICDRILNVCLTLIYFVLLFYKIKMGKKKIKKSKKQESNQLEKQMKISNIMLFLLIGIFSLFSTSLSLYYLIAGIYDLIQNKITLRQIDKKTNRGAAICNVKSN